MRKQRRIKTMRKFLNLTIMLMILFISISTVGCGTKDDYIEEYGEDEYIEYSDSEYYEEPQNNTISDKEINKLLKKYPDWRTDSINFAIKAFPVTNLTVEPDMRFIKIFGNAISATIYNDVYLDITPTFFALYRQSQFESEKSEKEILFFEKIPSIFKVEDVNNPFYHYFKDYENGKDNTPTIDDKKDIEFYKASLIKIKKNGKRDIVWSKLYPRFVLNYNSQIITNKVWTNKLMNNLEYQNQFLHPYRNKKYYQLAKEYYDCIIEEIEKGNEILLVGGTIESNFYFNYNTESSNLFNENFDWVIIEKFSGPSYPHPYSSLDYNFFRSKDDERREFYNQFKEDEILNIERLNVLTPYKIDDDIFKETFNKYIDWTYKGIKP